MQAARTEVFPGNTQFHIVVKNNSLQKLVELHESIHAYEIHTTGPCNSRIVHTIVLYDSCTVCTTVSYGRELLFLVFLAGTPLKQLKEAQLQGDFSNYVPLFLWIACGGFLESFLKE